MATIPGLSIMDLCHLTIEQAHDFLGQLTLSSFHQKVAGDLIRDILNRLRFLKEVGLVT